MANHLSSVETTKRVFPLCSKCGANRSASVHQKIGAPSAFVQLCLWMGLLMGDRMRLMQSSPCAPKCYRRAHYAHDQVVFKAQLKQMVAELEHRETSSARQAKGAGGHCGVLGVYCPLLSRRYDQVEGCKGIVGRLTGCLALPHMNQNFSCLKVDTVEESSPLLVKAERDRVSVDRWKRGTTSENPSRSTRRVAAVLVRSLC